MNVAIDLTGEMISYSYCDGREIVTEILRNTIGFRTKDLFKIDGALRALMQVTKDMIEFSQGISISEVICAVPSYCTYNDRKQLKTAASECGMNVRKVIRGSLASAFLLFQTEKPEKKTVVLCGVHSDHAELLTFWADGAVLEVLGSTSMRFEKDAGQEPENLNKRIQSELKAMYSELGMNFGQKGETVYAAFDEQAGSVKDIFTETLESCFGTTVLPFENDPAKGALYHLLKLTASDGAALRECRLVDCSSEAISIVSGVGDDLKEVVSRNSQLPVQKTVDLMVSSDNVVIFYSGNYRNRKYDEVIGTCRIPGAYRGQVIYVKATLNEDEIVEYTVLDFKKQIIFPKAFLN